MLSVLITGFGPFPGAPVNPTGPLVARLGARRRPALADVARIVHVFRTSYAAVDAELPALIARHRPDVLLMFGLAARTPYLRIETRARNAVSSLVPDAAGRMLRTAGIRPGQPALAGRAPFQKLLGAARAVRVPARLSRDAGSYLCNYAYWLGLEAARNGSVVAFVHVPRMGRAQSRAGKRAPTLTDLTRAGEAILLALVAAARASRHSGASGNSREGRRRREPGIHTPCAGVMDSGLAASRRPGMTEGHR
jgi:pyroglutamyl-peptidase